eukprot:TRINITY_DN21198_c0_g1_i2.p1 TRINITY_DN21198_c0_g1~~TRINITY_DN21198_c0_g1_i2.p1  ORF type:complete len:502 (+),score=82.10 TRINITY_DN21198_c0_g1_i2:63-1568(+)
MGEAWRVVHERVIRRASPSKDAAILGFERKGAQVSGTLVEAHGIRWLQTPMPAPHVGMDSFMMIEGSSIGLGTLLERVTAAGSMYISASPHADGIGSIGEALWRAPLEELPQPKWAPRSGFVSLCAGKASTGRRMLWVLGGGISDAELTNDIWRSVDSGFTWDLMKPGRHWSPRKRFGATVASTIADPSAQTSRVQAVVYIVGGQGKAGILGDVWASDTMCRSWHCMNTKAAFGPRADVACAAVPGKPLLLVVGGGISVDVHRDLWLSYNAGDTFGLVEAPLLPRGVSFRLWPPDIVCAAKASQPGQLAVWRLRIEDASSGSEAKAELLPLDEMSEEYQELELQSLPCIPRFALDLQAKMLLGWDVRNCCLTVQSLSECSEGRDAARVLDVVASAGDAHVLCDMDSVFSSLRNGLLWVISEEGNHVWVSGRSRLSAQDKFIGLLGLHLQAVYGVPLEIWFGRIRTYLMPRRSAVLDIGGVRLGAGCATTHREARRSRESSS